MTFTVPRRGALVLTLAGAAALACREHPLNPEAVGARPGGLRANLNPNAGVFTPGACPVQYPAQPVSSPFGVGANLWSNRYSNYPPDPITTATYTQIATLYRQANAGWVRVDFDWGRVIGTTSDTNNLNWAPIDTTVLQAWCRGVNILGNLAYTPGWAVNRAEGVLAAEKYKYLPDDMQHWEAFVRRAVNRYPQIRYWSIWNEPNTTGYFRGWRNVPSEFTADYNRLLGAAAPHIVGNVDGQGRRHLVALELGGGSQAQIAPWIRDVIGGPHAGSIDVFAYHHYARANEIRDKMYNLAGQHAADFRGWNGEIWLTEAGPIGCNTSSALDRAGLEYCYGTDPYYMSDTFQASHVGGVLSAMQAAPQGPAGAARWKKTFYWHSHAQVVGPQAGDDYGMLAGARQNSLSARPAFTAYADVAGPLGMDVTGDPSYPVERTVSATALPAVPSPQLPYYYVWEWTWCSTGGGPYDCPGVWYYYGQGLDYRTVSAYVRQQDYWVRLRVRQYTAAPAQGGALLSETWETFLGPGLCAPDVNGGCPMRASPPLPEPDESRFAPATGVPASCDKIPDVNCRRTWGARGEGLRAQARDR